MVGELDKGGAFFHLKPVRALLALRAESPPWYASSLAKEADCTFPHMIKVLTGFEELGLVYFKAQGRKKLIFLSAKGRLLADALGATIALLK